MTSAPLVATERLERRTKDRRWSVEFLLDSIFRPRQWGARLAYRFGLQGRLRLSTMTLEVARSTPIVPRSSPAPTLRVAFASDFHACATTDDRMLVAACDALTACRPDVLLLGGDYVCARAAYVERLAPLLAAIPAPLGKFGVLGNHDLHANHGLITSALERAGIRLIANQHVTLPEPFDDISICGLDDPTLGAPRADLALDGAAETRIVLMHSPDGLKAIGDREFALALCGHTHGGQIALPWGTPVIVPGDALNRQYCRGQYCVGRDGGSALVVSHGIGCSAIPIRLFAAPEVHLCLIT